MSSYLLESFITDLRSAKTIIKALKKRNPQLRIVSVPKSIREKILKELHEERGWDTDHRWVETTILGVWVEPKGPF